MKTKSRLVGTVILALLVILVTSLVLLSACTAPPPSPADDAKARFEQGNIYLKQGAWDKAITEFNKAINLNPELEAQALVGRGTAYAWAGDFEQAENDFHRAIKTSYGSFRLITTDAYVAWGIASTVAGGSHALDGQEAESLFDSAISEDPHNADAYTGRALMHLKEAYSWGIKAEDTGFYRLSDAISDFEKAIELDPQGVQGRIKRFSFKGDMAFLPNYIKANNEYAKAMNQYGAVWSDTPSYYDPDSGDSYYKDAVEAYSRVLKVSPDNMEALIGRGEARIGLRQYVLALGDFAQANKLEPNKPYPYAGVTKAEQLPFIKGNAYLEQDKWNAAEWVYTRAIEINPEFAEAYANRALACFRQMEYMTGHSGFEYEGVIEDCEKAIQLNPSLRLNKELARAYEYWGDYDIDTSRIPPEGSADRRKAEDKAIAAYSRAIMIDPDYAGYYIRRGSLYAGLAEYYLDLGQFSKQTDSYRKAIADLTRAIELEPSAYAYRTRGNIYTGMVTDYVKAVADYTRALELGIEYEWHVYFNRASVYAKLGKKDEAIADYTKVIELSPDVWEKEYASKCILELQAK